MAGIYIHIPFCKQACYYCDFHFSTTLKKKEEMVEMLAKEIRMRKHEIDQPIETIYFGGGTPSLLSDTQIVYLIDVISSCFNVVEDVEITLEANPDDLDCLRIESLAKTPVNRLSIGVQSFYEEDLKMMNRSHSSTQALESLKTARQYFQNISVDLIYGIPDMSMQRWESNIQKLLDLEIVHISCYALTVEPKTALSALIKKGKLPSPDEGVAQEHFLRLVELLEANGFIHYELSNFGKKEYFSKNNSAYWLGKKYLGIGPSAHSFDGNNRSWNIANNSKYIQAIHQNQLPCEVEYLSKYDRYNEYIMTGLRTIWGVSTTKIKELYGQDFYEYLLQNMQPYIEKGQLEYQNNVLKTTLKGKFFCDGIASDLFRIED